MTQENSSEGRKIFSWYREPYVWLLIAMPLAAVIGGIVTGTLALRSDDGLVVDDYYKRGLEINRVLERDLKAAELGIQADVQLSLEKDSFRIILTGNKNFLAPEQLSVSFLHATRGGYDRKLQVGRADYHLYQAGLTGLVKGRWHVQIEAGNWRILKTIVIQ